MHSPRFQLRQEDLEKIFSASNIKRVWKDKIRNSLRRDIIEDPLEYLDYHIEIQSVCERLQQAVCVGSYVPSSSIRIRMEKAKGLCRLIVIPNVEDALILQTLSDALYSDIKGKSPSGRSFFEPEDNAFSRSRELFGAPRYGSFRAWIDFQTNLFSFTKNRKYIVITDIANYYDSISYIHLRNVISGIIHVRESVLDMLIYVLSGMLWQPDYMPKVEIGLPQINIDAPRILAHCFLYELDNYLEKTFEGDFVRYMDDIDIGVDNIPHAKLILRDIDLILQTSQVRLNSGKTFILTSKQASIHFRIRENRILDLLQKRINAKIRAGTEISRERNKLSMHFRYLYRKKQFDTGNGEKILKRIINIASKIDCNLHFRSMMDIIQRRPNVRESAIRHVTQAGLTLSFIRNFTKIVQEGTFIDDVSVVEAAKSIVDAPGRRDRRITDEIRSLANTLSNQNRFGIYAAVWLASKYLNVTDLCGILERSNDIWKSDAWLGRVIGGLVPYFIQYPEEERFNQLIDRSKNTGALRARSFMRDLTEDTKTELSIRKFVIAQNTSKPLRISHAKMSMLLCILSNLQINDRQKTRYLQQHEAAWRDYYYRQLAQRLYGRQLANHDSGGGNAHTA